MKSMSMGDLKNSAMRESEPQKHSLVPKVANAERQSL